MDVKNLKYIILSVILLVVIAFLSQNFSKDGKKTDKEFLDFNQVADKIMLSDVNAPITIVEYSSFLCSHCANFAKNTFPQINEKYIKTGKIRWIFIITPPLESAKSAYCANEQGKFLEYHNYVFEHQSEIAAVESLQNMAVQAGLDGNAFNQCLSGKKYDNIINDLLNDGDTRGVDGTPTFFIGKSGEFNATAEKIVGNQPIEEFDKIITKY